MAWAQQAFGLDVEWIFLYTQEAHPGLVGGPTRGATERIASMREMMESQGLAYVGGGDLEEWSGRAHANGALLPLASVSTLRDGTDSCVAALDAESSRVLVVGDGARVVYAGAATQSQFSLPFVEWIQRVVLGQDPPRGLPWYLQGWATLSALVTASAVGVALCCAGCVQVVRFGPKWCRG